jgi:hypothetical protein
LDSNASSGRFSQQTSALKDAKARAQRRDIVGCDVVQLGEPGLHHLVWESYGHLRAFTGIARFMAALVFPVNT